MITVGEKEKGLEVTKNAAATLKSFCKWQNQQNPLDDDHQHHHDAAILFTRQVNKPPSLPTSPPPVRNSRLGAGSARLGWCGAKRRSDATVCFGGVSGGSWLTVSSWQVDPWVAYC